MRFNRLIMENFGPFKDPATIDFKNRDGVSIVWGYNGRGKTTILNAFNYVLNGTVKDRDGNADNFISFINESGLAEGKSSFKITLDLQDNGKRYRIVRSLHPMPGITEPKTNADVFSDLMVNEEGSVLSKADADHFVSSIMTKEVSRFFLFDGELLTEYEELLNENSATGGSIKRSIEQILGMPILTYGAIDAREAASFISTEARKVAQNESSVQKYTKTLESETEKFAYQNKELERLNDVLNKSILLRNKLQNQAEDTEKLRSFIIRKEKIEERMNLQLGLCKNEKSAIAELLTEAWKWMIQPTIKEKTRTINETIESLRNKERASKNQEVVIAYIQKALEDVYCPVCEREVSSHEKERMQNRLAEYKQRVDGLTQEERVQLESLKAQAAVFEKYLMYAEHSREITNRYNSYVSAKVKYTDLKEHDLKEVEADLESLKKNASGIDEKQAIECYDKLGKVVAEIAILEDGIEKLKGEIEETKSSIKRINETIISKSKNKDVVLANKRVEFAEAIASIFSQGIDVYRDKLSKDVEKDATNLFMVMNTEEDYGGLKINENYGLTIVRKSDGKPVPKRSAGWEHMVAFALIGALHKNAPFDGPVIMDSPFYRLDSRNTASMVRALPMIANQVLMLPYPGEIDPGLTRKDIGTSIVQELDIARISSNESAIKEMSNDG